MNRLIYRPAARADVAGIYRYIAEDQPRIARRFTESIRTRTRIRATYPEPGFARGAISPGLRILTLPGRVVVAYRLEASTVISLRIFYGGQDYAAFFRAEG